MLVGCWLGMGSRRGSGRGRRGRRGWVRGRTFFFGGLSWRVVGRRSVVLRMVCVCEELVTIG